MFFHDRPDLAGTAALGFVEYHRFTAVSYNLPLLDALVGAVISIAQANGIERAGHVRDKAEGSIEAEKMAMLRSYDTKRAQSLAMRLAGLVSDEN